MDNKSNEVRLLKIITILIPVSLGIVAALLVSLHWQLNKLPATEVQPPADRPSAVISAPVADRIPQPPAANSPPRQRIPEPAAPSHYTQQPSPAVPANPSPIAETSPGPAPTAEVPPRPSLITPPSPRPLLPEPTVLETEPEPRLVTVPSDTILTIRLLDTLNSQQNRPGDHFLAALDEPVFAGATVVVRRGAPVEGRVVEVEQSGRVSGLSEMRLELERLQLPNGQWTSIVTDGLTRQGEPSRGKDLAKVGTGAAIGAAIGAIAGGRRGAGIGAATGAGATTAEVLLTRGEPVVVRPETRLSFRLRAPVQVEFSPQETSQVLSPASEPAPMRSRWATRRPKSRAWD